MTDKMNCATCAKTPDSVPKYYFESAMSSAERTVKRLWITILVLIAVAVGTNVAWIIFESQFEDVYTEITQENEDGYNNYIGNDGDINNYGYADDYNQTPNP